MKKVPTKNIKSSKLSSRRFAKKKAAFKRSSPFVVSASNYANYAKVISYIIKSEENETNLMISSGSTITSK